MKVYLAGPDVFRHDAREWAATARTLCQHHGFEALTPLDHDECEAKRIFAANLALIDRSSIVVANLNAFRGCEPDSGTCFEVGYAHARGKRICAYLDSQETLRERVNRYENMSGVRATDNLGMAIEDFGLPLNLMLAIPAQFIERNLEACLARLRTEIQEAAAHRTATRLPVHPKAKQAIEAAIRYLTWVESGRISDPDARATIAQHYSVKTHTVETWLLDSPSITMPQDVDYQPDDIIRHMKISGRQYRSIR